MNVIPYANLVGCMMYTMVCSRPDLAHSLSVVSGYMSNPGKVHWDALKWILRYLEGTQNKGLLDSKYDKTKNCIVGFVDFDYATDLDKRRSLTGYIFTLYGNVISWKSTLQSVVALSST